MPLACGAICRFAAGAPAAGSARRRPRLERYPGAAQLRPRPASSRGLGPLIAPPPVAHPSRSWPRPRTAASAAPAAATVEEPSAEERKALFWAAVKLPIYSVAVVSPRRRAGPPPPQRCCITAPRPKSLIKLAVSRCPILRLSPQVPVFVGASAAFAASDVLQWSRALAYAFFACCVIAWLNLSNDAYDAEVFLSFSKCISLPSFDWWTALGAFRGAVSTPSPCASARAASARFAWAPS